MLRKMPVRSLSPHARRLVNIQTILKPDSRFVPTSLEEGSLYTDHLGNTYVFDGTQFVPVTETEGDADG